MFVFHEMFDDADRHAEALRGWNQRYDQIGPGSYRSAVKHAMLDGLQLFQEAANVRIIQRGRLPPGDTVFGMPLTGAGAFAFGGARIERGTMVVARGGVPFELHSPDDMSLIGVVADADLLQQVEDAADVRLDEATLRRGVVDMPTAVLMRASVQIATQLERVLSSPETYADARVQRELRGEVGNVLVDLLTYRMPEPSNRLTHACRADIVRRVHDYVIGHPEAPVDVLSLCAQLRVSRRTMQNSFQSVVQTSPLHYVRSLRLSQVRRMLLDTRQAEVPISDAAARWGFIHLGHFANAYKAQFGELPSTTARRSMRGTKTR
ncbi:MULTISPECIES: helix-turn-helix domain-containing protein [Burkholderia]|uniref:AraC family transcriptional regulator n=1 Tax=Burkholderia cenocepacia TaxID=95486 RepID=A0A071MK79_9BURK|nr:helix-turn-helix domain-containing protein [Burkholderia seminalis]MBN3742038.1 helix-turn-helix domain-containing protein [Burkholderia sp. Tr-20355]MCA8302877.1 helix-turn-helix domain-containing protein [Burkholderia seminalis]MCA8432733.1 helix-turn-helix domain-containing protein [Burkholderia seminalis]MDN7851819.1 helix-turn-helix domain-containing protein [Burkholderia seminalis]QTO21033.1 helix-turn-helix domain-containing protein [Burkholderia seminalis]